MYHKRNTNRRHHQDRFSRRAHGGTNSGKFNPRRLIQETPEFEETAPYKIIHQFSDFKIDPRIQRNILEKGYRSPTTIQDQSIPYIVEGKDLIGIMLS